jgi:hypothetical protein
VVKILMYWNRTETLARVRLTLYIGILAYAALIASVTLLEGVGTSGLSKFRQGIGLPLRRRTVAQKKASRCVDQAHFAPLHMSRQPEKICKYNGIAYEHLRTTIVMVFPTENTLTDERISPCCEEASSLAKLTREMRIDQSSRPKMLSMRVRV